MSFDLCVLRYFMSYLSWHYYTTNYFLIRFCLNYLADAEHFFSIGVLFKTLFYPWRRVVSVKEIPGWSISEWFQRLSFNLISRIIAFFVRLVLVIWGISTIIVLLIASCLLLVAWQFCIVLSLPIYFWYKHQNRDWLRELLNLQKPDLVWQRIINSSLGDFLCLRLGIDNFPQDIFKKTEGNLPKEKIKNIPDLVFWLAENYQPLAGFLFQQRLAAGDLKAVAEWYEKIQEKKKLDSQFWRWDKLVKGPGLGWNLAYGYTPNLDKYVTDLTLPQTFSHQLVGRNQEVSKIEEVLARRQENNVLLVGEPGVGKRTIILSFARKIYNGLVRPELKHKRVLELDVNRIIRSGSLSDAKSRLYSLLNEGIAAGNIIFVINNIDKFVSVGENRIDLTDVFSRLAGSSKIQIIGISVPDDYHRFLAINDQFLKLFEKVEVGPTTPETALEILMLELPDFEKGTKIRVSYQALKEIIRLSDRLISEVPFPEKAIDLLDEVIARFREEKDKKTITAEDIGVLVSQKTKVPSGIISREESEVLRKIEEFLHQRVVDQKEAIKLLGSALRRRRLNISSSNKPIGVFLFLGPTGVGKTETAKALAEIYFGSEKNLIRFDMGQYQLQESLDNLLGSDRQGSGLLIKEIKDNPFSVLLLDELEKANKNLLNIFMTVFDEGYIKDFRGKTISFRDTIIIATSNAGAEFIRQELTAGVSYNNLQTKIVDYIQRQGIFNPEFLNRFDSVVVYKPLSIKELVEIARLQLEALNKRLAKNDIQLVITDELLECVAEGGYNPEFGARPMKRFIADKIEDPIAKGLLSEEIKRGDKISLHWDKNSKSYLLNKI